MSSEDELQILDKSSGYERNIKINNDDIELIKTERIKTFIIIIRIERGDKK
jgi:hypothetical protein